MGVSKKILSNKIAKCEMEDVTRNPKEWITRIKILRGNLRKLDIQIYDSEMMTNILYKLPEE